MPNETALTTRRAEVSLARSSSITNEPSKLPDLAKGVQVQWNGQDATVTQVMIGARKVQIQLNDKKSLTVPMDEISGARLSTAIADATHAEAIELRRAQNSLLDNIVAKAVAENATRWQLEGDDSHKTILHEWGSPDAFTLFNRSFRRTACAYELTLNIPRRRNNDEPVGQPGTTEPWVLEQLASRFADEGLQLVSYNLFDTQLSLIVRDAAIWEQHRLLGEWKTESRKHAIIGGLQVFFGAALCASGVGVVLGGPGLLMSGLANRRYAREGHGTARYWAGGANA